MSNSQGTRLQRQLTFAAIWLLAALLMGGSSHAPGESVRILDGRAETVLQPAGTWTVPILKSSAIEPLANWPYWRFVMAGSLLLALLGRRMLARELPPATVFVAVTGLALVYRTEHFALAGILFVTYWLIHRNMPLPLKRLAVAGCLVVSLFVSIEFAFVLMISALAFAPEFWQDSTRRGRWITLGVLVLCLGGLACFPGTRAELLRPISWAWTSRPDSIFSHPATAFAVGSDWRSQAPVGLFFLYCWATLYWNNKAWRRELPLLFCLTLWAFGNVHFLWIAGFTLSLACPVPARSQIPARVGHAVLAIAMLLGLARFLPQSRGYLDLVLGEETPRLVDPSEWGVEGKVMLLDLSQSSDWQQESMRGRFLLLMDDRWEVFGINQYENYAAVCRDMREIRADSYLRSDLEWGGYKRWLKEWSPAVLVADSSNLWDVRRLSLSPEWRVMGIDAKRTIFGRANDPKNYRQSARALAMIQQLEWPSISPPAWHENVIAANSAEDLVKVSRVLTALRFPYAALRLLPDEESPRVRHQQTWCYMEIAHRVHRHAGQGSLIDQFRGVNGLRKILSESSANPEDMLRGITSIEGLGLEVLAKQLAGQMLESSASSSLTDPQRTRLVSIQNLPVTGISASKETSLDPEESLRRALLEGDEAAAREQLEKLPEPLRDYYALILSALNIPSSQLYEEGASLLRDPKFPKNRLGEAWFTLGCLALEAGNSEAAIAAFRESTQAEPDSPYHPLRQMYRMQLGDR